MHRECGFIRMQPGTNKVAFIIAQNSGSKDVVTKTLKYMFFVKRTSETRNKLVDNLLRKIRSADLNFFSKLCVVVMKETDLLKLNSMIEQILIRQKDETSYTPKKDPVKWTIVYCSSLLVLRGAGALSCMILDVPPLQHTWFKWSARHQVLLMSDNDQFIWFRCVRAGKYLNHAGQGAQRTRIEEH